MKIIPVILSGGSGTRLWPLSRKDHPKQYLSLASENTMLQETLLRLQGLGNVCSPIIVCNSEHRFLVAEQLQQINVVDSIILLEPIGRNSAPAIAAAAYQATSENKEEVILLVLSADHVIKDIDAFHKAILTAAGQAKEGRLVTFGVVPTNANTGYGYIKKGDRLGQAFKVAEFTEKPDQQTAESFFRSGDWLWNSGMFAFKAGELIDELFEHFPEIVNAAKSAVENAKHDLDFIRLEEGAFASSPSNSIDYALMEKSDNVVVVPLDANWSDIGSWSALYDIGEKDLNNNVIKGDVVTKGTTNSYINASHRMVTAIGVDNLIVIDTPDVTYISSKNKAHEVKTIVESLTKEGRIEARSHRKVYRPWGWYDSIEAGKHFQVKRLHVNPGAKLSLQMHHKRAEHWVVVSGIAKVTKGDKTFLLSENESTYIPIGVIHSLENPGSKSLEVIEVQSGDYLGEDDIVRFEDIYGRV